MESDRAQSQSDPKAASGARRDKEPLPPGEPRPVFWKELYWFVLILLGAWILAVSVLPPRLARNRKALEFERDLKRLNADLGNTEREYEAAIAAMENDPYYREAVYRAVLKVKKSNEILLKNDTGVSDN